MARKDRIDDRPFTCQNVRFETIESVFPEPLIPGEPYSLWLERVRDKRGGPDTFWLMWYDVAGTPTIPMSGVISSDQMRHLIARLADFIELG
jgi:hypothetical protein